MISGRNLFKKAKPLIGLFGLLFYLLPRFFVVFLWDATSKYSQLPFIALRYLMLERMSEECGDNVRIGANVRILNWHNLKIGNNVSIHDYCYLDASGGISIGDNVSIAHATSILSFEHTWDDQALPIKYNPTKPSSVVIKDDVWIGCGVRILSDVEIKQRSIVAAGAVLTKSFESNVILAGVPAKVVKNI